MHLLIKRSVVGKIQNIFVINFQNFEKESYLKLSNVRYIEWLLLLFLTTVLVSTCVQCPRVIRTTDAHKLLRDVTRVCVSVARHGARAIILRAHTHVSHVAAVTLTCN